MRDDESSSRYTPQNELPEKAEQVVFSAEKRQDSSSPMVPLDTKLTEEVARECDFDSDPTPLFVAIHNRNWDGTIKRAEEFPVDAMTWVSRKEKDGRMRWRLLPLHSAIIFKAPKNVVESLLCAYPKGAQYQDDQGMLPIHLAFKTGSSEDVVNLLLVAFPKSIDVRDKNGRIPLDLAQALNSPNKDAFIAAIQRGPAYYAAAAAATERAAVTIEQSAIFEAKLVEAQNAHCQEVAGLKVDYVVSKSECKRQVVDLENTIQGLTDHVSSLEAQLASRSDTERFLATKVARLASDLKKTTMTKESTELELKGENERLKAENEELKIAMEAMKTEETEKKDNLRGTENSFTEALAECQKKERKQAEAIKHLQADLIGNRNTIANLEAQIQHKITIEQTLASQVSTLASRLAESAANTSTVTNFQEERMKQLNDERSMLRMTIKNLAGKLEGVTKCLDAMKADYDRIVETAAHQETVMKEATQVNTEIVADAHRQKELHKITHEERETISKILERQDLAQKLSKEDSETLTEKVVVIDEQIVESNQDQEKLSSIVEKQRNDIRELLDKSLSVIPKDVEDDDDLIDAVLISFNRSEIVSTAFEGVTPSKEAISKQEYPAKEVPTAAEEAEFLPENPTTETYEPATPDIATKSKESIPTEEVHTVNLVTETMTALEANIEGQDDATKEEISKQDKAAGEEPLEAKAPESQHENPTTASSTEEAASEESVPMEAHTENFVTETLAPFEAVIESQAAAMEGVDTKHEEQTVERLQKQLSHQK